MSEGGNRFEQLKKTALKPKATPTPERQDNRPMHLDRPKLNDIEDWASFNAALPRHGYIVRGLLQEGSLYALTGFTGHAKTTVALSLALHISDGGFFGSHEHEVKKRGTVVFIAGENPSNVRDQYLAACLAMGLDPTEVNVRFIRGRFDHVNEMGDLLKMLEAMPDLRLVIVDTLQSFFLGEDDNSNAAMGAFARSWRPVCDLDSKPTVLIACHPAGKSAKDAKDNMVPRGGGAFINEIDANLSVFRDEDQVTLHWAGKFRGRYFDPVEFELKERTFEELRDEDGEQMPMSVLQIVSSTSQSNRWGREVHNMKRVLYRIDLKEPTSERALMDALGLPKRQVRNLIDAMVGRKIIKRNAVGGGLSMTRSGQQEFARIQEEDEAELSL